MKFYKIRAFTFLYAARMLAKILVVEKTPLVSVATIIERDGKILFLQLSYLNGLGLPGGIIQAGETTEDTIKREVLEETGLTVTEFEYLYSTTALFRNYPTLSLVFKIKTEGELKESKEGKLVWLQPEDAIHKLAYESNEKALKRYMKK